MSDSRVEGRIEAYIDDPVLYAELDAREKIYAECIQSILAKFIVGWFVLQVLQARVAQLERQEAKT